MQLTLGFMTIFPVIGYFDTARAQEDDPSNHTGVMNQHQTNDEDSNHMEVPEPQPQYYPPQQPQYYPPQQPQSDPQQPQSDPQQPQYYPQQFY